MNDWQPMATAPRDCTWVRVKLANGEEYRAHWASDLSGEEQPPFQGWFVDAAGAYYLGIPNPVAWQPL